VTDAAQAAATKITSAAGVWTTIPADYPSNASRTAGDSTVSIVDPSGMAVGRGCPCLSATPAPGARPPPLDPLTHEVLGRTRL
jgi:hypothetical protein